MDKWDRKIVVAVTLIASYLLIGTILFHFLEGWRFIDSFYFTGVTMTTVGYGDLVPKHDLTKIAVVIFAFSGVGIFFYSVSIIAQKYFEREEDRLQKIWETTRNVNAPVPTPIKERIVTLKKKFNNRKQRNAMVASSERHNKDSKRIMSR